MKLKPNTQAINTVSSEARPQAAGSSILNSTVTERRGFNMKSTTLSILLGLFVVAAMTLPDVNAWTGIIGASAPSGEEEGGNRLAHLFYKRLDSLKRLKAKARPQMYRYQEVTNT
ncbi:uncharacterized protein LOC116613923 [Nematostella vectensis]|uniref:uncharacterized protein LOC116613923 n=1 Tax=Nematostella vectensis TaxID=45351 RepID=UPI002076FFBF|nr:uncharacterized protein LOC116613923 [Nematostella vectensis]